MVLAAELAARDLYHLETPTEKKTSCMKESTACCTREILIVIGTTCCSRELLGVAGDYYSAPCGMRGILVDTTTLIARSRAANTQNSGSRAAGAPVSRFFAAFAQLSRLCTLSSLVSSLPPSPDLSDTHPPGAALTANSPGKGAQAFLWPNLHQHLNPTTL